MGGTLGASNGPMASINVTPLIDVVLVLLVVFMVIAPMAQSSQPVELPTSATSAKAQSDAAHITFVMSKDEGWFLEGEPADMDTLIPMVQDAVNSTDNHRDILLKADRDMTYGEIREALDLLAENNFGHVFIAVDKE